MSEKRKDGRTPIPKSSEKGPSWIAIVVTLVLRLFPVTAILVFLKLRAIWKNKKYDKFRKLFHIADGHPAVSLDRLAKVAGLPRSEVVNLLSEMLSNGYFGKEAYIDHSRDMLILEKSAEEDTAAGQRGQNGHMGFDLDFDLEGFMNMAGSVARSVKDGFQAGFSNNYRRSSASDAFSDEMKARQAAQEREAEEPVHAEAAAPAAESAPKSESGSGNSSQMEIIAKLRMVNDQIMDAEVSRKIDRIIELTNDIYAVVEQNPNRADQVRRFMNYYLPTTIKLLGSYGMMERQSYQGENIQASRRNIEDIMDTLVHAFEKQLDQLFAADAVDISSDIQVLETMIAKDGLTQQAMQLRL